MPAVGDDLGSFGGVGDGSDPLRYCLTDLVARTEMATFRAARAFKLVFCRLFGCGLFDYGDLASGSTCFQTSVLSFVWLRAVRLRRPRLGQHVLSN